MAVLHQAISTNLQFQHRAAPRNVNQPTGVYYIPKNTKIKICLTVRADILRLNRWGKSCSLQNLSLFA